MNTNELVRQITRRLPDLRKRDVQDVVEVLLELWHTELIKADGEIHLRGLGTLYVDVHPLRAKGIAREALIRKYGQAAPAVIVRRAVRFRPYDSLREAMRQEDKGHE